MANKDKFLKGKPTILDDIKREPAGSLQPMDANEGKWHNGINSANLTRLTEIADDVIETANKAVLDLVRAKMRIGKLLNEAREIFVGDNEFGKWRKDKLPDMSKTEMSYCMTIQRRFGSATDAIENIGWSVLRELAYAPESLVQKVTQDPESMPSNKAEAREMVQAEKAAIDPPKQKQVSEEFVDDISSMLEKNRREAAEKNQEPKTVTGEVIPANPPAENKPVQVGIDKYAVLTIEERWQFYLTLPVLKRIERMGEFDSDPFVLFGLAPDTEIGMISRDTLDVIRDGLKAVSGVMGQAVIQKAYDELVEIFEEKLEESKSSKFAQRIEAENSL